MLGWLWIVLLSGVRCGVLIGGEWARRRSVESFLCFLHSRRRWVNVAALLETMHAMDCSLYKIIFDLSVM